MKAFLRPRFKLLAAGFALLVLAATASTALLAGKPAPAPPPPPPPVLYGIQFWDIPSAYADRTIRKINKSGQVVGWYYTAAQEQRAFLYDPSINFNLSVAIDLNNIGIGNIPAGWVIAEAQDINDSGVIVGCLVPTGFNLSNAPSAQGFILDTNATTLALELLPPPSGSSKLYCEQINNNGDILVAYVVDNLHRRLYIYNFLDHTTVDQGVETSYGDGCRMNNSMQVSGVMYDSSGSAHYYRWDALTGAFDPIPGNVETEALDINDSGTVCGTTEYSYNAKKGTSVWYPCRYDFTNPLTVFSGFQGTAYAINSAGDLLCDLRVQNLNYSSYVYEDTLGKFYAVDSLIDPTDPNAKVWSSKSSAGARVMNNRIGTTGFGQLCGGISFANGSACFYLLTPK